MHDPPGGRALLRTGKSALRSKTGKSAYLCRLSQSVPFQVTRPPTWHFDVSHSAFSILIEISRLVTRLRSPGAEGKALRKAAMAGAGLSSYYRWPVTPRNHFPAITTATNTKHRKPQHSNTITTII